MYIAHPEINVVQHSNHETSANTVYCICTYFVVLNVKLHLFLGEIEMKNIRSDGRKAHLHICPFTYIDINMYVKIIFM
jgi:hypothetical protein